MKIGVDIDEVLADLMNPLVRFHNENYGTNFSREHFTSFNLWETWGGTKEEAYKKVYDFFHSDFFNDISVTNGSKEATNFLSIKNDLVIISSRPDYIKDKTIQWVNKNFPGTFSEVYFTYEWSRNGKTRKKDICLDKNVSVLIEDDLNKAIECASNKTKVFLYNCPWNQNKNLQKKILRVYSWEDILEKLD